MLRLWTLSSYWKTSMLMSNESETCTGAIGWNSLLDRKLSVFSLLRDFTANHSLSITNTVFEHKRAHKCTWHYIVGRRSVIHFVIISSDLRQLVLDIRSKRGAELSTDLVVSWIRWIR